MHLTGGDELALAKDLLEEPVAVCSLFRFDHFGQEGDT